MIRKNLLVIRTGSVRMGESVRRAAARLGHRLVDVRPVRFVAAQTVGRMPGAKQAVIKLLYGSGRSMPIESPQAPGASDSSCGANLSKAGAEAMARLKQYCA